MKTFFVITLAVWAFLVLGAGVSIHSALAPFALMAR